MQQILSRTALAVLVVLPFALWAGTTVMPHTFADGEVAVAANVNENFAALETAVNDNASEIAALQAGAGIPSGVILMWSGTLATIPTGWALCDGSNGTPNLLDRFVLGVGDTTTNPGEAGGSHSRTLTVAQLPSHSHAGTTGNQSSDHTHSGTTSSAAPEILLRDPGSGVNQGRWNLNWGSVGIYGSQAAIPRTYGGGIQNFMTNEPHSHSVTTGGASANHTHAFTTGGTGGGQPVDVRPAYFRLAYIMKL